MTNKKKCFFPTYVYHLFALKSPYRLGCLLCQKTLRTFSDTLSRIGLFESSLFFKVHGVSGVLMWGVAVMSPFAKVVYLNGNIYMRPGIVYRWVSETPS